MIRPLSAMLAMPQTFGRRQGEGWRVASDLQQQFRPMSASFHVPRYPRCINTVLGATRGASNVQAEVGDWEQRHRSTPIDSAPSIIRDPWIMVERKACCD